MASDVNIFYQINNEEWEGGREEERPHLCTILPFCKRAKEKIQPC